MRADGRLLATATHHEVVLRGAALMFISPDADIPRIAYAVGSDFRFDGSSKLNFAPAHVWTQ